MFRTAERVPGIAAQTMILSSDPARGTGRQIRLTAFQNRFSGDGRQEMEILRTPESFHFEDSRGAGVAFRSIAEMAITSGGVRCKAAGLLAGRILSAIGRHSNLQQP